ncbi:LysM peptidoglycan-binding domain-containing protein [uncultured Kocuria sp.]|uniref:LysM peptidoglycan-binding domain-containing protein n=1 Tax=uncultured Kocuria sp. TaxID=259305 RepID=UPI0025969FBF|nr:LysM peptidoglycan-binding domain-containing protein [uncultured Kocuria sp.]MCT1367903.1 LysM peptidoglycan-binding domain-containing protein [Rothia sp. p3-SID1597]
MRTALAAPRSAELTNHSTGSEVARRSNSGHLTLTRRGRFLFIGLPTIAMTLCVAAVVMLFLASAAATASGSSEGRGTETVVVGSGETLWEIASEVDPGGDTRKIISQIDDLNDLTSGNLNPGQRLIVPVISNR